MMEANTILSTFQRHQLTWHVRETVTAIYDRPYLGRFAVPDDGVCVKLLATSNQACLDINGTFCVVVTRPFVI